MTTFKAAVEAVVTPIITVTKFYTGTLPFIWIMPTVVAAYTVKNVPTAWGGTFLSGYCKQDIQHYRIILHSCH